MSQESPKRREKLEEMPIVRLSMLFAFLAGVAAWAPWSIYRGVTSGTILVPLCHWDCTVSTANPAGFAGAIALWLIVFVLTGLCAFGFGLALWRRRNR